MAEEAEIKLSNLTVADEPKLKLFSPYKLNTYGQRVEVALKEKNISFQVMYMNALDSKAQELPEVKSISKRVPTIIHNGKRVAGFLIILEYLEDAFSEQVPLMPKDAYGRSKCRFWIDYIYKSFNIMRKSWRTKRGTPEHQEAIDESTKILKTWEEGLASFSGGPFFAGENFGMVDVGIAPICNTLQALQEFGGVVIPGPDQLPRFHKWIEAVRRHPSVSSTVPPLEEMTEHLRVGFEQYWAPANAAATDTAQ